MSRALVLITVLFASLTATAGVTINSPANGATVPANLNVSSTASAANPITAMRIYVDNNSVYTVSAASINTNINVAAGGHHVVVVAWDSTGASYSSGVNVTAVASVASGVSVGSPSNGASVSSPVQFNASASAANPVVAMMVYIDNIASYNVNASSLNTALPVAAGSHYVVVQAWDSTGAVYKTSLNINVVAATTATSLVPSTATVISEIDQFSGWQNCTTCAGAGGTGPTASYSMIQGVSSPSLDGNAAQFWLGGSTPYSNALWWKQLGGNNAVSNFVYDVYFYMQNPSASQALEFDVNQSANGQKFIFGTECNYRGNGQWDVWDTANAHWVATGVACSVPTAYTWHHLTWQFQRANGQARFVAVTLDGVTSYVNKSFNPQPSSVSEINVAFQMDGNYAQTPYNVWLDRVKLSYW